MLRESVNVRVRDAESFGRLCVALSEDRVPFTHTGFHTVLMRESALSHLPPVSQELFQELRDRKAIDVIHPPRDSKARRRLPSPGAAALLLDKFSNQ